LGSEGFAREFGVAVTERRSLNFVHPTLRKGAKDGAPEHLERFEGPLVKERWGTQQRQKQPQRQYSVASSFGVRSGLRQSG
jgi:hypothetical protein